MATVELVEVSKQLGQNTILDKINLSIKKGEFMVVVGPSGCGKSTLLRLIAGLDELSSGQIVINEQCVNKISAAKRDMAMVFQNYALYPHMSVFDNMAYGLKMRGFKKDEIKKRVTQTADLLQLSALLDRKPQALSGGQRQRVAMGRAIVRSPSVFLFDEPLSNLDAKLRTQMRHEIKKLHQQLKITSLYVTHDQTEAMTMADRILVLNQGKVEQIGTPQELYQHPNSIFVAGFTGHYPVNFIEASYNKDKGLIQTKLGLEYPADPGLKSLRDKTALVLGFRAEHIKIASEPSDQTVALAVEFIDDMGADKLIIARCVKNGKPMVLRVQSEVELIGDKLQVELPKMNLHVFLKKSGKRIGD